MNRFSITRMASLAVVGSALAVSPAFAKDAEEATRPSSNATQAGTRASKEVTIPTCLSKLQLSAQQQEQVKEVISKYDASIDSVWSQFSDRYRETVNVEASLLTAIEDNLSEAQRKQVRDQRHKMAHQEKMNASTATKPNSSPAATAANPAGTKAAATGAEGNAIDDEIGLSGITLTSEQEAAADKIQGFYVKDLRSLNRDIQGFHTRLVALEADKHAAIEKVLTKEQLTQLRQERQTAPVSHKITANTTNAGN